MKNKCLLVLCLLLASLTASVAQKKTKEEKALEKEWSKKLREVEPLDYKRQVDELAAAKAEASENLAKLRGAQTELENRATEVASLKTEVDNAKKKAAEETATDVTKTSVAGKPSANGVQFKVQIGSFRKRDLSKYLDNNPNFTGETDPDGTKKYTLGYFGDYWEADKFKKYLREMGVRDAWIVAYKDGQRVNVKDVLEGAI